MARKSKFAAEAKRGSLCEESRWQAAIYVRLSREDGDKEESDSIANQRTLLIDYVRRETDIEVYDTYIDDGWSGANFDRPDFLRMMENVKNRSVNCVIVKDLSRFGRNYIESGNYIEKVFPLLDVRFIAVNDNIDSFKNPQSVNNLMVPFKNIINDEYCRDISNKVRSSLDLRRRQGKFIGSFATYGYKKDPADRGKLLIDEYAAEVVRDIYRWFICGVGIIGIAKRLNAAGVLNPTAYKQSLGLKYRHPAGNINSNLWPDSTVRRILTNRMYIGNLVQGKNRTKSYKVNVSVSQPEEEWIEIENVHDAVIDRETFETVQNLLKRDIRTSPKKNRVYLFSGFLRCYDCDRAMNRKLISRPYGEYSYYICSTYKKMNAGVCTKHTIRSDKLEEAVLTTLQKQVQLAVSMDELISVINKNGRGRQNSLRLEKDLADKNAEIGRVNRMMLALYPDWKNGDLTREEYLALKGQFTEQARMLKGAAEHIKKEMESYRNGVDHQNTFLANFSKYCGIKKLTREMLIELVEYIYVHEGGGITIHFKFADEFAQAVEYIETNRETASA